MTVAELQDFFSSNTPPSNLADISKKLLDFLNYHKSIGNYNKKIVLITSGGTTVPLETNTVRFIDNFSAGTRGSLSAEYFLDNGYLVIFFHREFSLQPYVNHIGRLNLLDLLDASSGKLALNRDNVSHLNQSNSLVKLVNTYHKEKENYLLLSFTSINEYLFILKSISEDLKRFYKDANRRIMLYLAAAVSDFFVPQTQIPEHKIQSNTGSSKLVLNLDPVPKFLTSMVNDWYNNSYIISFKLETDDTLLSTKCRGALTKYDHQLVIGNMLQTRKEKVMFVSRNAKGDFEETQYQLANPQEPIEAVFIPEVIKLHQLWIEQLKQGLKRA